MRSNRRQTQQKKSRKGLIIGIVVVIIVAVMAVGLFILSRTDLFPVNKITVSGFHHLTDQETAELAAVPEGTTVSYTHLDVYKRQVLNAITIPRRPTWMRP